MAQPLSVPYALSCILACPTEMTNDAAGDLTARGSTFYVHLSCILLYSHAFKNE